MRNVCVCVCVCVCECVCVYACAWMCAVHLYCSAQLCTSNMEKRYRNKIIIIINRLLCSVSVGAQHVVLNMLLCFLLVLHKGCRCGNVSAILQWAERQSQPEGLVVLRQLVVLL